MKGLLSYSGIVTKIRAMQSDFLTEDDFREIVALPDVPSVADYLKKIPQYANVLDEVAEPDRHRGYYEMKLQETILLDFDKLYRFADQNQKNFLRRFARRYEVRVLKRLLTEILESGHVAKNVLLHDEHFGKYSSLDLTALSSATDIDSFLDALKGTIYEKPLRKVRTTNPAATQFDYETALDLFHFNETWKEKDIVAGEAGSKILTSFFGTKFDLLNLWYIYRARTYYTMDNVSIYALTIPHLYRLQTKDVKAMVEADSPETYRKALSDTWYGRAYPDMVPENLQYMYTKIMRETIAKGAEAYPYSIAALYQYLYLRQHEVYRLITAMECVRYGMDAENAMAMILKR